MMTPTRSPRAGPNLASVGYVYVGGGVGASLRYLFDTWWAPPTPPEFPWVTLLINLTGAFVLAFVTVLASTAFRGRRWLSPLIGTGLVGGFTTWPTFIIQSNQLLGDTEFAVSIGYMFASLIGGLCTALAGRSLAFAYDDMRRAGQD
jgi:fluoride exporter